MADQKRLQEIFENFKYFTTRNCPMQLAEPLAIFQNMTLDEFALLWRAHKFSGRKPESVVPEIEKLLGVRATSIGDEQRKKFMRYLECFCKVL